MSDSFFCGYPVDLERIGEVARLTFDLFDINGNGMLSKTEIKQVVRTNPAAGFINGKSRDILDNKFNTADTNGDSELSLYGKSWAPMATLDRSNPSSIYFLRPSIYDAIVKFAS